MQSWIYAVIFLIAALFGLRGSVRLTRRYIGVRDQLDEREALILVLLVGIAWVITLAAGFYGFLAVRTLLGLERIPGLAPISAAIAILVLFLPTIIDAVVDRVSRVPWR